MTRRFVLAIGFALALALGVSADAPVDRFASVDAARQDKTVTLSGCVRTGSASTVYILRGAADQLEGLDARALPEDYLIASVPNSVSLADHVNHRVEVQAAVTEPSQPPGPPEAANAAERALKRLSVRQLKELAPNCAR